MCSGRPAGQLWRGGCHRPGLHGRSRLPAIGFDEILPVDGAFYVYASVARFTNDALDFAGRMLREAGVAATPGPDFDHDRGHRYMRFSFAGTEADIGEGIERLAKWLK